MKPLTRRSFGKTLTSAGAMTVLARLRGLSGTIAVPSASTTDGDSKGQLPVAMRPKVDAAQQPFVEQSVGARRQLLGVDSRLDPQFDLQQSLEKVFGDAVRLDPLMRAKVLSGNPGERFYVDKNGDGKPEEVWFIDTDSRHPSRFRPLLVKVIDTEGDLVMGHEPGKHGNLYVADWNADGKVDAVIQYKDFCGDRNLHEMTMFFGAGYKPGYLSALWSRDVGRDHLLWYDEGYIYDQQYTQYRSHFGADVYKRQVKMGLSTLTRTEKRECLAMGRVG